MVKLSRLRRGFVEPATLFTLCLLSVAIVGTLVAGQALRNKTEDRSQAAVAEPCHVCRNNLCVSIAEYPDCTPNLDQCVPGRSCGTPPPDPTAPPYVPRPTKTPTPKPSATPTSIKTITPTPPLSGIIPCGSNPDFTKNCNAGNGLCVPIGSSNGGYYCWAGNEGPNPNYNYAYFSPIFPSQFQRLTPTPTTFFKSDSCSPTYCPAANGSCAVPGTISESKYCYQGNSGPYSYGYAYWGPIPTPTPTPQPPTATPLPTATATTKPLPTTTSKPTNTPANTQTPTITRRLTPTPTKTPSPIHSQTPYPTDRLVAPYRPSLTPIRIPTSTPTISSTRVSYCWFGKYCSYPPIRCEEPVNFVCSGSIGQAVKTYFTPTPLHSPSPYPTDRRLAAYPPTPTPKPETGVLGWTGKYCGNQGQICTASLPPRCEVPGNYRCVGLPGFAYKITFTPTPLPVVILKPSLSPTPFLVPQTPSFALPTPTSIIRDCYSFYDGKCVNNSWSCNPNNPFLYANINCPQDYRCYPRIDICQPPTPTPTKITSPTPTKPSLTIPTPTTNNLTTLPTSPANQLTLAAAACQKQGLTNTSTPTLKTCVCQIVGSCDSYADTALSQLVRFYGDTQWTPREYYCSFQMGTGYNPCAININSAADLLTPKNTDELASKGWATITSITSFKPKDTVIISTGDESSIGICTNVQELPYCNWVGIIQGIPISQPIDIQSADKVVILRNAR